ncbi:MAG: flippase [Candidatus Paceibacterota bacterium]
MEKLKTFFFQNTNTKQTIVKNTFWLFLSETSGRLLKMGLIVYAARVLGASGWGLFSYAISVASLLTMFADIGISDLVLREITQKKDGHKTFISTALLLKVIVLVISTFLVIFVSPFISHIPQANSLFFLVALILFFDSMRELGLSINRASEKMERDMVVKVATNASIFILGVLLLKMQLSPKSIALAYAIGSAIGFITVAILIRKELRDLLAKVDLRIFKTIIKTTWPFVFITLIGVIMGNIDIYMLGIWKNAGEIGLYSSVQRIQQFIMILPSTIAVAVFPLMSRLVNVDKQQFRVLLEKTLSMILLMGIPVAIGGILLADQIILKVFGQDYVGAIPIFQVLMLMLLISFPLVLLSNAIFAHNKQRNLAPAYTFGIIANVIFNLLLIPKFGAVGSAVATLVSTGTITLFIWMKLKKINDFAVLKNLKKSFLATLVMICFIFIFKYFEVGVMQNIFVSAFVYFATLLLLKESIFKDLREMVRG